MAENALRRKFKSYGARHHRKWVLAKGHSSIDNELKLLKKFQNVDSRNFHAWNYRRFVAALMNSVLLSSLMKKKAQGFLQKDEVLIREYEFVREVVFTDEDNQSSWFYHL